MHTPPTPGRHARSGAVAGAVSALGFTALHDVLISDIWATLPAMLAAGALCGACVAWSYALLVAPPSAGSWLRYNLVYVGAFVALGAASVLVFEPVTTVAALMAANEPPNALFAQAMPMTALFTAATALGVSVLYGARLRQAGAVLVTCVVLVALLGLNVSVIGLVDVPSDSVYLIAELFGLIVALDAGFAVTFMALERRHFPLRRRTGGTVLRLAAEHEEEAATQGGVLRP